MLDNVVYVSFGGEPEIVMRLEQLKTSIERINKLMEELRNERD
jgi:hypothetical protein